jgi:hypothetical protein
VDADRDWIQVSTKKRGRGLSVEEEEDFFYPLTENDSPNKKYVYHEDNIEEKEENKTEHIEHRKETKHTEQEKIIITKHEYS